MRCGGRQTLASTCTSSRTRGCRRCQHREAAGLFTFLLPKMAAWALGARVAHAQVTTGKTSIVHGAASHCLALFALRWLCAIKPANIIITHGAAAVLLRYREPLHLLRRWCSQFMQWCCEHAQLQPLQHHCATCAETLVLKEQPRVLDKFSATATRCTKQDNR